MVTSKGLAHNYSHTWGTPTHTCLNIPTLFWPRYKEWSALHCFFTDIFNGKLSHTVYIHCLKSSHKRPHPRSPSPPFSVQQVTLSCFLSALFKCRYTLLAHSTLVWHWQIWQDFPSWGVRTLLFSSFRTFFIISRLKSVCCPISGIEKWECREMH